MSSFGIIAISPPSFEQRESFETVNGEVEFCFADASIALAASACGETGVIDVECTDISTASSLDQLEQALTHISFKPGTKYGIIML